MGIAEPTANWYRVLWVEDVAGRRVVDDDCLSKISSYLAEILDIVSLVVVAAFSEQSVMNNMMNVELVQ